MSSPENIMYPFKKILVLHLVSFFNKTTSSYSFPNDMLNLIIVTLPKQGKDLIHPQGLEPVFALNLHLKIYANTIGSQLFTVTLNIYYPDQTKPWCYQKNVELDQIC